MNSDSPTELFIPLPANEEIALAWPTPNRSLFSEPTKYFAKTRVNPSYGMSGWTRDCGRRAHYGCDIAPLYVTSSGAHTTVEFTDCKTGADFLSEEPVFIPHDDVYCVFDGKVHEVITDDTSSPLGQHIVISHRWPKSSEAFFTVYAHLTSCDATGDVHRGQRIGQMGQTSSIADARNWMLIAPHLHFEVRDLSGHPHDPIEFLRRYLSDRTFAT
jgi:hypothetical protein